jgi:hypothetical protein
MVRQEFWVEELELFGIVIWYDKTMFDLALFIKIIKKKTTVEPRYSAIEGAENFRTKSRFALYRGQFWGY